MKDEDLKKLQNVEWLKAYPAKEALFSKISQRLKPVKIKDSFETEVLLQAALILGDEIVAGEQDRAEDMSTENSSEGLSSGGFLTQTELVSTVDDVKKIGDMMMDFSDKQFEQFEKDINLLLKTEAVRVAIDERRSQLPKL